MLTGKLKDLWSARAWPYRTIYQLEKDRILILKIIYRQKTYK